MGGDGAAVRPEREVGQPDGEVPPLVLHAPPNGLLECLAVGRRVRALRAHPSPAPPLFNGNNAAGPWRVKRSNATLRWR